MKKQAVRRMSKIQAQSKKSRNTHQSVMVSEILKGLGLDKKAHLNEDKRFIDATLGTAGHSRAIANSGANVLGIDMDQAMLEIARENLKGYKNVKIVYGNFKDIKTIAQKNNFIGIDGVIFDLGVSNLQLTSQNRGFSFSNPKSELDMRIDASSKPKASDLLNLLRKDQLEELFLKVLTKNEARKIALEIDQYRKSEPFKNVVDFLEICRKVFPDRGKINPATRAFLALRIAVNSELENLKEALSGAFSILAREGKILVISFHSAEDVLVKDFFRSKEKMGLGKVLTKKPIVPSAREVEKNPKSRSAKLRIFKKI